MVLRFLIILFISSSLGMVIVMYSMIEPDPPIPQTLPIPHIPPIPQTPPTLPTLTNPPIPQIPPIPIVFIYLGPVSYIRYTLSQARLWNPRTRIIFVTDQPYSQSGIDTIQAQSVLVHHQKELNMFDASALWGKRFVHMASVAIELNLTSGFWHPEADNMLYYDFSLLDQQMKILYANSSAVTPLGKSVIAPGIMYFDSIYAASELANEVARLTKLTKDYSIQQMKQILDPPKDHAFGNEWELKNDMAILFLVHKQRSELLGFLPVLPSGKKEEEGPIFDCCSFGQFLGGLGRGTNILTQHGWTGRHQYQGKALADKLYTIQWRNVTAKWQPTLVQGVKSWPIANLHVYSKSFERFSQAGLDANRKYRIIPRVRDERPAGWSPPF